MVFFWLVMAADQPLAEPCTPPVEHLPGISRLLAIS
jgi:hypothetical protein